MDICFPLWFPLILITVRSALKPFSRIDIVLPSQLLETDSESKMLLHLIESVPSDQFNFISDTIMMKSPLGSVISKCSTLLGQNHLFNLYVTRGLSFSYRGVSATSCGVGGHKVRFSLLHEDNAIHTATETKGIIFLEIEVGKEIQQ